MPYWITNPDHGIMPVYDMGEVERNKAHGWTLLNVGEIPIRAPVMNGDTEREPERVIEEQSAEQVLKESLAESMRLDPPPKRKPGRPPKAK